LANKMRSTFAKRQKELAREARQKTKQAKRLEKKAEAEADPDKAAEATTEDSDLIGIVPGPQPRKDDDFF
jgi:hypothetical protein